MASEDFTAPSVYWEHKRGAARKMTEDGKESYDVAIIGAGIMGLLAAFILTKRGKKVCVMDKGAIGSEAAGNNGGIVLDLMEGSPIKLAKRYHATNGEAIAQKIAQTSLTAVNDLRHLERDHGIKTAFKSVGYITVFSRAQEWADYRKMRAFMAKLFPHIYKIKTESILERHQTGSAEYPKGYFSKNGGIYNPATTILSLLKHLHGKSVDVFENTEVETMEAGTKSSVNVTTKDGYQLNAKRVILAGGGTYNLLHWVQGLVKPQPVVTAMLATSALPDNLFKLIANGTGPDVPVQGSATYSPPYWRFEEMEDGKHRLLFGAGGRAGKNETDEIGKDVLNELLRIFPMLEPYLDDQSIAITTSWARELHYTENEIPQFVMASPASKQLTPMPELTTGQTSRHIPRAPIIGVFGLAGHGNAFSIRFAKILAGIALNERWAYTEARVFGQDVTPMRPFNLRKMQSRLASER